MVELSMVRVLPPLKMPPPEFPVAEFPAIVELEIVPGAEFQRPPPSVAVFPEIVDQFTVSVPPETQRPPLPKQTHLPVSSNPQL